MRKIKFKFWGLLEKSWLIDGRTETSIYDFAFKNGMNWNFITKKEALERVVVVQYTGLKDKNGKEIYEGDVVRYQCPDEPRRRGESFEATIEYVDEVCSFRAVDIFGVEHPIHSDIAIFIGGNIYENPEFLKKEI